MDIKFYKLEIFIPETHFKSLQKVLQEQDAGCIGNYDSCLSYSQVIGVWRPFENTKPYLGTYNDVSEESELKVEVIIKAENLKNSSRNQKSSSL